MKIIAGLGNPGSKYETTRHNAGFLAVDRLIDVWKASGPSYSYDGEIYQATVAGEKVLLIKPETFMNLSGKCIAPLLNFYKCELSDLIVIHDDLDLRSLVMRLKTGGGTGGNNGLKSIDAALGAGRNSYHRVRIGIGRPAPESRMEPVDFVLQQFTNDELKRLDLLLDDVERAVSMIIAGDMKGAMNRFNVKEKDEEKSG